MTDQEYLDWLRYGSSRCILVEIDADEGMIRLSDRGYVTSPGDTPANTLYQPAIAGGVSLTESLPISGTARMSVGDVELHNEDGSTEWLRDIPLHGRAIRIYYGDPSWPRDDFRLQIAGVIASLGSRKAGRLNIILQDRLAALDVPVATTRIGGAGPNADVLRPVVLGEVHNLQVPLETQSTHAYRVHDGTMERLIEVRNNGAPVSTTDSLSAGTFVLTANPSQAATITASIQGDKTGGAYRNTVAALVELLATKYAGLAPEDLDSDNLTDFETDHPQPVGLAVTDTRSALQCAQNLASSVGAQVSVSRLGQLRLLKLALPATPVMEIRPEDYEQGSLRPNGEPDIIAAVTLGYCRNWLVQQSLAGGVPPEHVALYQREWLTATKVSTITATTYRLPVDVEQQNTLLLRKTDAETEAQRRLDLWKVPRRIFTLTGFASLLPLEPGMGVTLYHPAHGLSSGKNGIVISARPDWSAARNTLEILI